MRILVIDSDELSGKVFVKLMMKWLPGDEVQWVVRAGLADGSVMGQTPDNETISVKADVVFIGQVRDTEGGRQVIRRLLEGGTGIVLLSGHPEELMQPGCTAFFKMEIREHNIEDIIRDARAEVKSLHVTGGSSS